MQGALINKSDVYGLNTQAIFGENEPTILQGASGDVGFDEGTPHAPVKTVLIGIAVLVGLRILFEFV